MEGDSNLEAAVEVCLAISTSTLRHLLCWNRREIGSQSDEQFGAYFVVSHQVVGAVNDHIP